MGAAFACPPPRFEGCWPTKGPGPDPGPWPGFSCGSTSSIPLGFQATDTVSSLSSGGVGGRAAEYSFCQAVGPDRDDSEAVDRRNDDESNDWVLALASSLLPLVPPPIVLVALLLAAGFRDKKRETDEGFAGTEPCEARRFKNFLDSGDDWCWCSC